MGKKPGAPRKPYVPPPKRWRCWISGCSSRNQWQNVAEGQTPREAYEKHYNESMEPDHGGYRNRRLAS
jgi:hypothetical protein